MRKDVLKSLKLVCKLRRGFTYFVGVCSTSQMFVGHPLTHPSIHPSVFNPSIGFQSIRPSIHPPSEIHLSVSNPYIWFQLSCRLIRPPSGIHLIEEWIDGCMGDGDGWTDGWIEEWIDGCIGDGDRWMDGFGDVAQMLRLTDRLSHEQQMDGWIEE